MVTRSPRFTDTTRGLLSNEGNRWRDWKIATPLVLLVLFLFHCEEIYPLVIRADKDEERRCRLVRFKTRFSTGAGSDKERELERTNRRG